MLHSESLIQKSGKHLRSYSAYKRAGWIFENSGHLLGNRTLEVYKHKSGEVAILIIRGNDDLIEGSQFFKTWEAYSDFYDEHTKDCTGPIGYDLAVANNLAKAIRYFN